MKHRELLAVLVILTAGAIFGGLCCGGGDGIPADGTSPDSSVTGTGETPDSVLMIPLSPLEVALQFSNELGMNDPACLNHLSEAFLDSLPVDSLSPQELFGRWRAFDASGRLTAIEESPEGRRTSYACTITRMERPAINRIHFLIEESRWTIDGFAEEVPQELEDSLTIEQLAELVLEDPVVRRELRVARLLWDDCIIDSTSSYSSLNAAVSAGADPRDFILDLQPESYSVLASSNIRRAAKFQIIYERTGAIVPVLQGDLATLMNIVREMSFLYRSVVGARHEAMQHLYSTGEWIEPDLEEDLYRLGGFRDFFLGVSDLVERDDSLSRTYRTVLSAGSGEPLAQVVLDLDPHQLEQRMDNQVGVPVWRALGVEMNGDRDPERVVYWAGDLYLFQGTPTGYSLVWRTYEDYESDFHADFISQPSGREGCREVTFTGNDGEHLYYLGYDDVGVPLFRRIQMIPDDAVPGEVTP